VQDHGSSSPDAVIYYTDAIESHRAIHVHYCSTPEHCRYVEDSLYKCT